MKKKPHRYRFQLRFKPGSDKPFPKRSNTDWDINEPMYSQKEAEYYHGMLDDTVLTAHLWDNVTEKVVKTYI